MKWTELQDNWEHVRDRLQIRWAKLTSEDLQEMNGEREELVRVLQRRHHFKRRKAEDEAEEFVRRLRVTMQ